MAKRILRDFSTLEQNKEFVLYFEESNINNCDVLFFGPDDSPYHLGIYLFHFDFESYPLAPPKVTFTTGSIMNGRIHPNLYREGKVCLSILGTWGKEDWSPTLTLEKICITIKALLDNNPIRNEPGYEKIDVDSKEAQDYIINAKYLTLKTIRDTVNIINTLPVKFQEKIQEHITKNKEKIDEYAKDMLKHNGKKYKTIHHDFYLSPIWK